jgi:hypothetical protein
MTRTADELAHLADKMFSDGLARELKAQIAQAECARKAMEPPPGGVHSKGIATGYLGDALYDQLGVGSFSGRLLVEWNGFDFENDRPTFIFRPEPAAPFRYTTSSGRVFEPRLMDTDGGTIPLVLHGIKKFAPWGYAPAYVIHDWLFVAHKCNVTPDNDVSFAQSVDILGEAIKTLMVSGHIDYDGTVKVFPKAEDTLYLIHMAVGSSIAKGMWDHLGNVVCR